LTINNTPKQTPANTIVPVGNGGEPPVNVEVSTFLPSQWLLTWTASIITGTIQKNNGTYHILYICYSV